MKRMLLTLTLLGLTFAYFNALKITEDQQIAKQSELTEEELYHYSR